MAQQKISYTVRDFAAIRQELINYTKTYYPDLIDNFNDASVFSVFLDLNAAVADNLHYHIDRSIQETVFLCHLVPTFSVCLKADVLAISCLGVVD